MRPLLLDFLHNVWFALTNVFSSITPIDLLDIALLTALLFTILKFVRETRAGQLMKGVLFVVGAFILSDFLKLRVIRLISLKALSVGLIAIIVLFQPELRRVLEKFGSTTSRLSRLTFGSNEESVTQWNRAIPIIAEAVAQLSKTATGALIVIERNTKLGEQISNGTVMKAEPSVELFGNIFFNKTPLHDGAVIMRDGIIWAAACFLPKPQKEELIDKHLGSRHRAAIGMSENSDALVIVVSEETGQISVAHDGVLTRNYTKLSLEKLLRAVLIPQDKDEWRDKMLFRRAKAEDPSAARAAKAKEAEGKPQEPLRSGNAAQRTAAKPHPAKTVHVPVQKSGYTQKKKQPAKQPADHKPPVQKKEG
ncbi:MAG: diadenylate cyclase CdaA [Oscillospiraceae bacterium]|nr:diadenylate cyclase CdaA [Oscillospiraceae bacterium]